VLPGQVTAAKIKAAQNQGAASQQQQQQFLEASTAMGSGLAGLSFGLVVDIFAGKSETDATSNCSRSSLGSIQTRSLVICILVTLTGIREPLLPPLAASLLATAGTVALLKEAKNPSSEYSEELKTFSELVNHLHSFSPYRILLLTMQCMYSLGDVVIGSADSVRRRAGCCRSEGQGCADGGGHSIHPRETAAASGPDQRGNTTGGGEKEERRPLHPFQAAAKSGKGEGRRHTDPRRGEAESFAEGKHHGDGGFCTYLDDGDLWTKIERAPDDVKAYVIAKVEERKKALVLKAKVCSHVFCSCIHCAMPAYFYMLTSQELQEEIAATPAALQARAVESAEATLTRLQELPVEAKDALASEIQRRLDRVNQAAEELRTKAVSIASDPIAALTNKKKDGN